MKSTTQQPEKSYVKGAGAPALFEETIGQCIDRIARTYPDREALVVRHQDVRLTYADYQQQIDRLATGLLNLGVRKGDRVGIWGPNSLEWCLTQFATAKIGAILVCINPAYRPPELAYALNKSGTSTLITAPRFQTSDYLDMLNTVAPELADAEPGSLNSAKLPQLKTVIRMGDAPTPGMFNFAEVCRLGGNAEQQMLTEIATTIDPYDPINIQFTSGTTGSPKGATLSHHNILNNAYQSAIGLQLTHEDRFCIPLPLYHCAGMVLGTLASFSVGCTAVLPNDGFDPALTLQTVSEEQCTALSGVPTMFIAQLEHPDFDGFDLSRLRTGFIGGAPCPIDLMHRIVDDMNMRDIMILYGQTETSPVNHLPPPGDRSEKRLTTIGKAAPNLEIKIVDSDGHTVDCGQVGELCCRGYAVMLGYWEDDAQTKEAIDADGWMHSGDTAVMDDDGYVQIVGRLKDMIIRGGENIYPREIEEVLYTHPAIQEAQVFGIPDRKLGERVCTWIQLRHEATVDADDVRAFCKERLAHFKIPSDIRFVDTYPMTVTGKIQKYKMAEMMAAEGEN